MGRVATAIALLGLVAGCSMKGLEDGSVAPPLDASITIVDPVEGQTLVDEDDEDLIAAGFQVTVSCAMAGLEAGEPIRLTLTDDRYGVSWSYDVTHDGTDTLAYPGVVFWPGDETVAGEYTLTARSLRWDIQSNAVHLTAMSLAMDAMAPGAWEVDCSMCEDDSSCDDGLACNGREVCAFSQYRGEFCCYIEEMTCPPRDECTLGRCSEETGACMYAPVDSDGDGHPPTACGFDDCDDLDYSVHPGAVERCDGLDNDCDGAIDENAWVPVGDALTLSSAGYEPLSPVLAGGPGTWAVAWIEDRGPGSCAAMVGAVAPDATGPVPSVADGCIDDGLITDVALVTVPSGFLYLAVVQETSGSEVHAAQLEATGSLSGAPDLLLTFPASIGDLAAARSDSGSVGLVFRSDVDGDYELYFLAVSLPTTTPHTELDVLRLTDSEGFSGHPSLVGLATGFGLAWEDGRDGDTEIYFATLADDGALLTPERRITTAPGASEGVSLASSPDGSFALAWMDAREGGYDMLLTCLDYAGIRTCPELSLEEGPSYSWYPAVAYDGHVGQYALAFAGLDGTTFDLHLSAISVSGSTLPDRIEPGQTLSEGARSILSPSVADAGVSRGVLSVQNTTGGVGTLMFTQLACGD